MSLVLCTKMHSGFRSVLSTPKTSVHLLYPAHHTKYKQCRKYSEMQAEKASGCIPYVHDDLQSLLLLSFYPVSDFLAGRDPNKAVFDVSKREVTHCWTRSALLLTGSVLPPQTGIAGLLFHCLFFFFGVPTFPTVLLCPPLDAPEYCSTLADVYGRPVYCPLRKAR